jgi:hypothetical protein
LFLSRLLVTIYMHKRAGNERGRRRNADAPVLRGRSLSDRCPGNGRVYDRCG